MAVCRERFESANLKTKKYVYKTRTSLSLYAHLSLSRLVRGLVRNAPSISPPPRLVRGLVRGLVSQMPLGIQWRPRPPEDNHKMAPRWTHDMAQSNPKSCAPCLVRQSCTQCHPATISVYKSFSCTIRFSKKRVCTRGPHVARGHIAFRPS